MGPRNRKRAPVGELHRQVLGIIRDAGPKGISIKEIAGALGITREATIRNCLMAEDPVYEDEVPSPYCGKGRPGRVIGYFWCGKEASNG